MSAHEGSAGLQSARAGLDHVRTTAGDHPVEGWYRSDFLPLLDAFIRLHRGLADEPEVGSTVSVYLGPDLVAELWGGWRDRPGGRAWSQDTLVNMMSVAKGVTAMCVHMLADRGLLDLDAPVAQYWPQFAANGKSDVLVRHILDHTAGLSGARDARPGDIYHHEVMARLLAAQPANWPAGTRAGYHIRTQGFLLGELVRRVDGRTVGRFLREEIAGPLHADFSIGLTDEQIARCAQIITPAGHRLFDESQIREHSLLQEAYNGSPDDPTFSYHNEDAWRRCEIPSSNGHGTARGVARIYAAFATDGGVDGIQLCRPEIVERAVSESHNLPEEVLGRRYHQALGFLLDSPPILSLHARPKAFGHHGVGGSLGFGDRDGDIGFGYGTNRLHQRPDNGPRAGALIDALYASLG
jgi:CubicO group peptidase (beta-lactamase class C family)